MAGNTQMTDSERGIFSLVHGITGMLIATVLLLSILATLTVLAISTQAANAQNYYTIDQDLNALKSGCFTSDADQKDGSKNHTMWKNVKGE
jgi:succinate dehydrogenase/fumarate reductase cytochrome b subunit